MDKRDIYNIGLIFTIGFLAYLIFRNMNFQEGFDGSGNTTPSTTTSTTPSTTTASSSSGIAGGAANYSALIKSQTIKLQDTILISKYRADYENIIMNMDELVNNLMLQTVLTIDQTNPKPKLANLVELNQSKNALNNVMKFIDSK